MSDRQRIRDMIELEVFLFAGVPERPNPVYGRDSYANVRYRTTRALAVQELSLAKYTEGPPEDMLQKISINPETGKIEFGEYHPGGVS